MALPMMFAQLTDTAPAVGHEFEPHDRWQLQAERMRTAEARHRSAAAAVEAAAAARVAVLDDLAGAHAAAGRVRALQQEIATLGDTLCRSRERQTDLAAEARELAIQDAEHRKELRRLLRATAPVKRAVTIQAPGERPRVLVSTAPGEHTQEEHAPGPADDPSEHQARRAEVLSQGIAEAERLNEEQAAFFMREIAARAQERRLHEEDTQQLAAMWAAELSAARACAEGLAKALLDERAQATEQRSAAVRRLSSLQHHLAAVRETLSAERAERGSDLMKVRQRAEAARDAAERRVRREALRAGADLRVAAAEEKSQRRDQGAVRQQLRRRLRELQQRHDQLAQRRGLEVARLGGDVIELRRALRELEAVERASRPPPPDRD
eukprot:TRINITY_DN1543_c0_g1_i1.p1 TRINITY_DN1543_c0_g1~~TRINITY_DN1543_c0_g1_i1.p1  ORF type:complete len:381 (+),score=132.62 TRINITY_DN1543_c0_g1_i1:79-1221(+)